VNAQLSQVRALNLREEVERRIWTITEDLTSELGLDRRVANALWDAFFGRHVTAGYYRSLTDVSAATATHDLSAAVAARLLLPKGERRGRQYFAGPRLYEVVGQAIGVAVSGPEETARAMIVDGLSKRITA
jgi:hypothetical protein